MPDGSGAVMIDGKMQDDATWKQARVIVDLAGKWRRKDADLCRRSTVSEAEAAFQGRTLRRLNGQSQKLTVPLAPQRIRARAYANQFETMRARNAKFAIGQVVKHRSTRFAA